MYLDREHSRNRRAGPWKWPNSGIFGINTMGTGSVIARCRLIQMEAIPWGHHIYGLCFHVFSQAKAFILRRSSIEWLMHVPLPPFYRKWSELVANRYSNFLGVCPFYQLIILQKCVSQQRKDRFGRLRSQYIAPISLLILNQIFKAPHREFLDIISLHIKFSCHKRFWKVT